eukprot:CAMPEP_0118688484 /NCGR_PEP_ID=MMETSP0800-20121206/8951_1 /TAXON_ID=210618 ORGANISM="Striatella unipunctata, Strain CCMP2910" /NCGR_SAMPLE_ID=MMETSP0800 /ASSEMBLY_ACC=CAM_ASM_000638 /LENGTH=179 /DNA_ID=CAMNT_0006585759 /DNA_START=191 /DNA_END=730 /DNA_ORIENTATION=+
MSDVLHCSKLTDATLCNEDKDVGCEYVSVGGLQVCVTETVAAQLPEQAQESTRCAAFLAQEECDNSGCLWRDVNEFSFCLSNDTVAAIDDNPVEKNALFCSSFLGEGSCCDVDNKSIKCAWTEIAGFGVCTFEGSQTFLGNNQCPATSTTSGTTHLVGTNYHVVVLLVLVIVQMMLHRW